MEWVEGPTLAERIAAGHADRRYFPPLRWGNFMRRSKSWKRGAERSGSHTHPLRGGRNGAPIVFAYADDGWQTPQSGDQCHPG